jgi:hypothetical protein
MARNALMMNCRMSFGLCQEQECWAGAALARAFGGLRFSMRGRRPSRDEPGRRRRFFGRCGRSRKCMIGRFRGLPKMNEFAGNRTSKLLFFRVSARIVRLWPRFSLRHCQRAEIATCGPVAIVILSEEGLRRR